MKSRVLLFLFGMGAFACQAQTLVHIPPLVFSRRPAPQPVPVKIWDGKAPFQKSPFPAAEPRCWGEKEQHTPFFCQLESMSMKATHVWFKIHAGDYDAYSRRRW